MGKSSTSFKKGHKPASPGRPKLPADIRAAKTLSYEEMCRTVIEIRSFTPKKIKGLNMEEMPLGKRAIINAYIKLDYNGIRQYEDRLWGKATETIDANVSGNLDIIIERIKADD